MKFILILLTLTGVVVQGDVDVGAGDHRHRVKRATAFSASEIQGIVDLHNEYRSTVTPVASNMRFMRWDDTLATMAQIWSNGCNFNHGNPNIQTPFSYVGQNLWAGTFFDDGRGATTAWYNEEVDYDFNTDTCATGKVCGHYTQVVWAESYAVGCGRTFCPFLSNFGSNAYVITCNYGPGGNVNNQPVYLPGPSCTECSTGSGECYNNLCRPCSEHTEPCECRAVCNNCGIRNSDCTCTCRDGWRGSNCASPCVDTDATCGNGWPSFWCGDSRYPFVDAACHLFCGYCNPIDPTFTCSPTEPTTTPATTTPTTTQSPTTTTQPPTTTTPPPTTTTQAPTTTTQPPTTTPTTTQPPTTTTQPPTQPPTTTPTTQPPITTSPATESTTATTTQATCTLSCLNGGTLDVAGCTCTCRSDYQGNRCQNSKAQVQYGVKLTFGADISIFSRIREALFSLISRVVTDTCNTNTWYSLCCPGATSKNTDSRLTYVDSNHVSVANGYPEDRPEYSFPAFSVMLLVTPPTPNELCSGSLQAIAKRNVQAAPGALDRTRRQTESSSGYLSQDVLYETIFTNLNAITNAINATILEVTRGVVEESNVLLPLLYTVLLIIAAIILLVIAVALITICWGRNTDSHGKGTGGKRKQHPLGEADI